MLFLPFCWSQHGIPLARKAVSVSQGCSWEEVENSFFLKTLFAMEPLEPDTTRTQGWLAAAPQQKGWTMRPVLAERIIFGSCGVPSPFCFVVRASVVSGGLRRLQFWSWKKCEMMFVWLPLPPFLSSLWPCGEKAGLGLRLWEHGHDNVSSASESYIPFIDHWKIGNEVLLSMMMMMMMMVLQRWFLDPTGAWGAFPPQIRFLDNLGELIQYNNSYCKPL